MPAHKYKYLFVLCTLLVLLEHCSFSQDNSNSSSKIERWAVLQAIPSPSIIQDAGNEHSRVVLGLNWQVTPLNISFHSGKFVSPAQFFIINPVGRFTGSIELFSQPGWTASNFEYGNISRFSMAAGSRVILPVIGEGESLSISGGAKYTYRKDLITNRNGYFGIEAGAYSIYGFLGVQLNYNFDSRTRYQVGLYFKYL